MGQDSRHHPFTHRLVPTRSDEGTEPPFHRPASSGRRSSARTLPSERSRWLHLSGYRGEYPGPPRAEFAGSITHAEPPIIGPPEEPDLSTSGEVVRTDRPITRSSVASNLPPKCRSRTRPPAPTIATSDSSRRRFRQRAVRTGRQWADCDGRQHSTKPSTRSRTANLPIAGHLEEVELDDAVERGQAPRCALLDHPGCEPLVVPPSHRGVRHLMITTRCATHDDPVSSGGSTTPTDTTGSAAAAGYKHPRTRRPTWWTRRRQRRSRRSAIRRSIR